MSSPAKQIAYYVEIYLPDERSPEFYCRIACADVPDTLKALLRARIGPSYIRLDERAASRRIVSRIKWRRRENDETGGLVDSFGGYNSEYYFRNAEYQQAIESLSAEGFVEFDRVSDGDCHSLVGLRLSVRATGFVLYLNEFKQNFRTELITCTH